MTNQKSLEERVMRVEEMLTHEQHTISQLNEVVINLRNEIESLRTNHAQVEERLNWMIRNQAGGEDMPHEKPPHY